MSKSLVIVGTSGFAAEVTQYVKDNISKGIVDYRIKGYLDISDTNMSKYGFEAPLLGSEKDYYPGENDFFIVATGAVPLRNRIIETLKDKRAKFINLIHYSALISETARIGMGNIICPNTIVGPNSTIGDLNIINYFCAIAHDVKIGDANVIAPFNNFTGWSIIGNGNVFGSNVTLLPKVQVGSMVKVQAGTVLNRNVSDSHFCYSNLSNKTMPWFSEGA